MKSLSSAPHHSTKSAEMFRLSLVALTGVLKVSNKSNRWTNTQGLCGVG